MGPRPPVTGLTDRRVYVARAGNPNAPGGSGARGVFLHRVHGFGAARGYRGNGIWGCSVIARVEWGFDMRMRGRTRALALAVVLTTAAVAGIALPAHASSYPSWSDVQNARRQRIRQGRRGEADRRAARREPGGGAAHREARRAAGR